MFYLLLGILNENTNINFVNLKLPILREARRFAVMMRVAKKHNAEENSVFEDAEISNIS